MWILNFPFFAGSVLIIRLFYFAYCPQKQRNIYCHIWEEVVNGSQNNSNKLFPVTQRPHSMCNFCKMFCFARQSRHRSILTFSMDFDNEMKKKKKKTEMNYLNATRVPVVVLLLLLQFFSWKVLRIHCSNGTFNMYQLNVKLFYISMTQKILRKPKWFFFQETRTLNIK